MLRSGRVVIQTKFRMCTTEMFSKHIPYCSRSVSTAHAFKNHTFALSLSIHNGRPRAVCEIILAVNALRAVCAVGPWFCFASEHDTSLRHALRTQHFVTSLSALQGALRTTMFLSISDLARSTRLRRSACSKFCFRSNTTSTNCWTCMARTSCIVFCSLPRTSRQR